MRIRCPVCEREVNAPKDVISKHKNYFGGQCKGTGRDALPLAIEQLAAKIDNRARWIEGKRVEAAALVAKADSENAALDTSRSKLAVLRRRLDKRAKDGAR
jgi:hypothetical protein